MTTTPRRIQRKDFLERLPEGTKLVARPTRFGNNVSSPRAKTIEAFAEAVEQYRRWLMAPEQEAFRQLVRDRLRGFDLACYCPAGWPCHAEVLLELANQ